MLFHDYFKKRRAINAALKCEGWTSYDKLSFLYNLAKHTSSLEGDILEIGSAWGRSLIVMSYACDKKIWSIDPHTGGRAFIEKGISIDTFEAFKRNIEQNNIKERVIILRHTTSDVMSMNLVPASQCYSLVFIDGLHTAEGVQLDFTFSWSRLVKDGIMIFDDYHEKSVPDYTKMIDALALKNKLELYSDKKSGLVYFVK
jgi:predicted O-methyltransferase YrrM